MQIWIVFRSIISKICYGRKTWRSREHAQEMWKRLRVGGGVGAVCVISGGWMPTQMVAGRKRMNKHLYIQGLPKRQICVGAQGCGLRGIGERAGPWGIITLSSSQQSHHHHNDRHNQHHHHHYHDHCVGSTHPLGWQEEVEVWDVAASAKCRVRPQLVLHQPDSPFNQCIVMLQGAGAEIKGAAVN